MNVTAAHRFALELRTAMEKRDVTNRALSEAIGVSNAHIVRLRFGRSLPFLASAIKLADALDWPQLVDIVRKARAIQCVVCSRFVVTESTGSARRYCSPECRIVAVKSGRAGKPVTIVHAKLTMYAEAVDSFCLDCNPTGLCHDGACPLRSESPLPLADGVFRVEPAQDGRRNRWDDPSQRVKASEKHRSLWKHDDARRARIAESNRKRWADMTPERRAEVGRNISAAIRGRRCGRAA